MKSLAIAVLLSLSATSIDAQTPPGVHKETAPVPHPMKRFTWRDEAAGYTFVGPPRWVGRVRAVPLPSKALASSGATSGVRFLDGDKVVLELLAADDGREKALVTAGATELSRSSGHVVAVKTEAHGGELALTNEELASAVQWDGGAAGTAVR